MKRTRAKPLKFRPYARLLTMLGDQLIKNERVALVELIKNAYDADATWVKLTFQNFNKDFQAAGSNAKIIVEDDGIGMSRDIIENHWVNPATPSKLVEKKRQRRTTKKGRIIQGEKGIGRFALLKLGRCVEMTTRAKGSPSELTLKLDVSSYDEDFLSDDQGLFLDELRMTLSETDPAQQIDRGRIPLGDTTISRRGQGTRLEISHLQGSWTRRRVEEVHRDLGRLQSIFERIITDGATQPAPSAKAASAKRDDFRIYIYRDDVLESFDSENEEVIQTLLEEKTVFRIEGEYDEPGKRFDFSINGKHQSLKLLEPALTGLKIYRDTYMPNKSPNELASRPTACGSFKFKFYIFNFANDAAEHHLLSKADKELIREHRIYLYRDGIRVYPYGDPSDDWLMIDVRRGTVKASEFVSNDQTVGVVEISQDGNPNLRDKTSREGLVEVGEATDDFRALIQIFLAWVRADPYDKLVRIRKNSEDIETHTSNAVERSFDELSEAIAEGDQEVANSRLGDAKRNYFSERRYLVKRAEDTEHLAGVGLSVEAASHDLMLSIGSMYRLINDLMELTRDGKPVSAEHLAKELTSLRGMISFVEGAMTEMQRLFRSTKQKRKQIRVEDILTKVQRLYASLMKKRGITYEVQALGSPLMANTTDAVLLQVFLNLFDNSCYWLEGRDTPRNITVVLDGDNGSMIFADTGPGFRRGDLEFIFEPFFSGKGEDGRGLGLYIARQLLARHEYTIEVTEPKQKVLPGANLTISFVKE
ncbi:sensor histidine kinase [Stenotrophomonas indicatrix]|uniref:sensor histidine kinase n=1 Tax=Stenotrophomonas indicatrix TaxID=2045451 RepID=UPI0032088BA6